MGKAYSTDLRQRVSGYVASGHSCRAAGRVFGVSASTAVRVVAEFRATGSLAPKRQGRAPGTKGKLAPHILFLVEVVQAEPDITLRELSAQPSPDRSGAAGSRRSRSSDAAPCRTAPSSSGRSGSRHHYSRAVGRACPSVQPPRSWRDQTSHTAIVGNRLPANGSSASRGHADHRHFGDGRNAGHGGIARTLRARSRQLAQHRVSGAGSKAAGHRGNRPSAAACGGERRRPSPLQPRTTPLSAVLSAPS